jgi:hypothetical protein
MTHVATEQMADLNAVLASVPILSDLELTANIRSLVGRERRATALLVAHLAEADARRLAEAAGYGSLFVYCCKELGLSEHEAYARITAARAARRFPFILELLIQGSITLTNIGLLAPHLTPENHGELLGSACRKRKNEVEEIVARLRAAPDVATTLRRLPMRRTYVIGGPETAGPVPSLGLEPRAAEAHIGPAAEARVGRAAESCVRPAAEARVGPAAESCVGPAAESHLGQAVESRVELPPLLSESVIGPTSVAAQPSVTPRVVDVEASRPRRSAAAGLSPLAADRYRYQLTIDTETRDLLELARALLRHADPSGDDAVLLKRALKALVDDLLRAKFGASGRPSAARPADPASRHVGAAVKRAVFVRDRGSCAFVSASGRRCGERGFLEFHHLTPFAAGGGTTVANLQLRCRRHNQYEARVYFMRDDVAIPPPVSERGQSRTLPG